MKVDIAKLLTIKNYAVRENVTPAYIYKLVKEKKMQVVNIDGVQFIDTSKFPMLPTKG